MYPATGWFDIVEILTYNLNEFMGVNDEYIDKSSTRIIQFFNNTWICRYPRPQKVIFDNGYEFKQNFTHLLNYFDIKPVLETFKKP